MRCLAVPRGRRDPRDARGYVASTAMRNFREPSGRPETDTTAGANEKQGDVGCKRGVGVANRESCLDADK